MSEWQLPSAREDGLGFVYVIAFRSGTIKVGKADDPQKRVGHHSRHALVHGDQIEDVWISPAHAQPHQTEQLVVAYCNSAGQLISGREYFRGLTFDAVVKHARSIDLEHAELPHRDSLALDNARVWLERRIHDNACYLTFGVDRDTAQASIDALKTMTWGEAKELVRRRRERDKLREGQDLRFIKELEGVGSMAEVTL